jgi:hypothetical protein
MATSPGTAPTSAVMLVAYAALRSAAVSRKKTGFDDHRRAHGDRARDRRVQPDVDGRGSWPSTSSAASFDHVRASAAVGRVVW